MDDSPCFQWIELEAVNSTNNYLKDYRPARQVSLTLVTAEYQTAGRGAGENQWESERGKNLLFSLQWLPKELLARHVFATSEALALSLLDALNDIQPGFSIKWPNDIYYKDYKVAGTLIENDLMGKFVARSIMGTGINVNQTQFVSNAPNPRSIAQITGQEVEVRTVLQNVMYHFAHYRRMIEAEEFEALHEEYKQHLYRWDEVHTYSDANGTFAARITNVEPDGHLVLTDTSGQTRRYGFKEVSFVL